MDLHNLAPWPHCLHPKLLLLITITTPNDTQITMMLHNYRSRQHPIKIWPWKSRVKVKWPWCCTTTGLDKSPYQILILKIQGQGQMTVMLHNYRSRQFYKTSNGIYPSSGFRDMGSAKSGPSAAWFDKLLAHGQAQMGKWLTLHNYRSRQVHETLNGVNPSRGFRDMHSAKSLDPICGKFVASPYGANGQMTMTVH